MSSTDAITAQSPALTCSGSESNVTPHCTTTGADSLYPIHPFIHPFDSSRIQDVVIAQKMTRMPEGALKSAALKAFTGARLASHDLIALLEEADLMLLGALAARATALRHSSRIVGFQLAAALPLPKQSEETPEVTSEVRSLAFQNQCNALVEATLRACALGARAIELTGALRPEPGALKCYEDLFAKLKGLPNEHGPLKIQAMSSSDIETLARVTGFTVSDICTRLKTAGLDSLCVSAEPLDAGVLTAAAKAGLVLVAALEFDGNTRANDLVQHLCWVRGQQDKTSGFKACSVRPHVATTAVESLKVLAVCRLALDNVVHIQISWSGFGPKIGQSALHFGASDIGAFLEVPFTPSPETQDSETQNLSKPIQANPYPIDRIALCELIARSGFHAVERNLAHDDVLTKSALPPVVVATVQCPVN